MSEPESKLSVRTLAMRRSKLGEVLLEAHALLRISSTLPAVAGEDEPRELFPLATRIRLIALLAAAFTIVTEGWSL